MSRSSTAGFLGEAVADARSRVVTAARATPLDRLRTEAIATHQPPSFAGSLRRDDVGVIAEIKRASPSAGDLASIDDPVALARAYATGGAAAISVLTEPDHFRGSLEDLRVVTAAVDLPTLRKDFVVDAYQIWEARRAGAAAVLLIVAALETAAVADLLDQTRAAGMDALVEVHSTEEASAAQRAYAVASDPPTMIVGVNARDLASLTVEPATFEHVCASVPASAIVVAESGVKGPDDVRRLGAAGADAVLVGEYLVRSTRPSQALRELVNAGRKAPA